LTDVLELARAYEAIVQRFVTQARSDATIRAAVVVGSRARTDHPADEWADLDILVWSDDRDRYLDHAAWLAELGDPLITFVEDGPDPRVRERRALFAGGLDVDFAFVDSSGLTATGPPLRDLAQLVLGRGVRILLDPEGIVATILAGMPPQRAARRAEAPDASALDRVTADFWYHAVWTAKHLRRGELWWAKGSCDGHLKGLLLSVLEWDAATAGRDPWFRGRYLEEWADPPTVAGLRGAFARYDADELWSALAVTMDLFSRVARRVAGRLAVTYPDEAEGHARALVREYDLGRRGSPADVHEP
jgi:aminoglycoside 6-adenylyltransferase